MRTNDKPIEDVHVSCAECLKEVPLSEAKVFEASDYFVHFCGLECYKKWTDQREKPTDQVKKTSPQEG